MLDRGRGSAAAELGPGRDPVVLVLQVVAGPRRRSRPAGWPSSGPCRSRPRPSRGSPRSGRARAFGDAQASGLVGASPNQTVAWALPRRDIMWSIHMSMQFGCCAFAIIQVSDQPVEPSSGRTRLRPASVGAWSRFACTARWCPGRRRRLCTGDLVGVQRPVGRTVGRLGLEQVDRCGELRLVELVRVGDPELRLLGSSGGPPRRRCRSRNHRR